MNTPLPSQFDKKAGDYGFAVDLDVQDEPVRVLRNRDLRKRKVRKEPKRSRRELY